MKSTIIVLFLVYSTVCLAQKTIDYKYDAFNRLTEVKYGNGSVITYSYDELGNRKTLTTLITGIEPVAQELASMVSMYPNPTSGQVDIVITDNQKANITEIKVFDLSGKLILKKPVNRDDKTSQIDLSSFTNGVYNLQFISSKGNFSAKVIKQ